jgi:hypothetical protein
MIRNALRRFRGVRFVCRAPTRSGRPAELRVTEMTLSHVRWWNSHVQPIIDRDPERADRGWNWLLYVSFATLVDELLFRRPAGYTVGLVARELGCLIPCALVQVMGRFPGLDDHDKTGAFVWFLSTAPDEALRTVPGYPLSKKQLPKRLGSIALDVAITHSLNRPTRGRLALYADEAGGKLLVDWYRSRGMEVLDEEKRLPLVPRRLFRPSDGRYCYYTPAAALSASRELDPLR